MIPVAKIFVLAVSMAMAMTTIYVASVWPVIALIGFLLTMVGVIILACGGVNILIPLIFHMPMPGVRCPTCASRGIETWVLPGKHCPACSTACRNILDVIVTSIYLLIYGYISITTFVAILSITLF